MRKIDRWFLILILIFSITVVTAESPHVPQTINVVLRLDDCSASSPIALERKIYEIFHRNHISLTLGVVPFVAAIDGHDPHEQPLLPLADAKINLLRQAAEERTFEIALHGFSHQTNNRFRMQEFAGLEPDEQMRKMAMGKQVLEEKLGAKIETFIPPWNRYDKNTLSCMEKLNLATISASCKGKCIQNYSGNYLPTTCCFGRVEAAILAARNTADPAPLIIALFHFYDFYEVDQSRGMMAFSDFARRIEFLCSQKDVRILSVNQCAQILGDFGASRFLQNKRLRILLTLLPPRLRSSDRSWYVDSQESTLHQAGIDILTTGFVLFMSSFFLFLGAGYYFNVVRRRSRQIQLIILICSFSWVAGDFLFFKIYWPSMIVSSVAAGLCLATVSHPLLFRLLRPIQKNFRGAFEPSAR